ncbi:HAD family hydrolase [Methanoregula sp.]|uniref:HAD family hydrolase n=1 Tax=Methanoregula sp. TaxID=2052170 RepID=UPI003C75BF0A
MTTVLFDMDNTLFDLVGAQISSCHKVVQYLGQDDGDELFSYFLKPVHGFESHENIRQYMQERDIPVDGNFTVACTIYENQKLAHITPYAGVTETLQTLRNQDFPMCIVTDAHSRDATLRMERSGLLPFFSGMVSWDMAGAKKPSPEPFLTALGMMQAGPEGAVFIGDSPRRDIQPCTKLGIRTVYARYGDRFSPTREFRDADFIIDAMDELPAILAAL